MNTIKLTVLLVLGSSLLLADNWYGIKSGKVLSKTTSTTKYGLAKTKEEGSLTEVFDDYGKKIFTETKSELIVNVSGSKTTKQNHMLMLTDGKVHYRVDFKHKKINKSVQNSSEMDGLSLEEMLVKVGGKKVGTDTVLGYTCTEWEVDSMKACLYKGVTLRETGKDYIRVATKAEFDITLTESDFKLPDYPIKEEE